MNLIRCPRCELNFMLKTDKVCRVCQSEIMGEITEEEIELCSVCGRNPVEPNSDMCTECRKDSEENDVKSGRGGAKQDDREEDVDEREEDEEIDETLPLDDVNDPELGELEHELSLEAVAEDEDRDSDDEEEEEE